MRTENVGLKLYKDDFFSSPQLLDMHSKVINFYGNFRRSKRNAEGLWKETN
jgi:hypothetical protein